MHEPDAHDQEYLVPPELRGFERLYGLLAGLTSSRSEQSFYERLQVLLLLARWQGGPPTLREIGRQLPIPLEESIRRLQQVLTVEQTSLVQEQHQESRRNVRMAEMALELRERGAVDHD